MRCIDAVDSVDAMVTKVQGKAAVVLLEEWREL